MKVEIDNFIGIYRDVFPEGYCEHMISEFERITSSGAGINRKDSENASKHYKDDLQLFLDIKVHNFMPFRGMDSVEVFFEGLQVSFNEYLRKYSILETQKVFASTIKMQRTSPGGGYHLWHYENGSIETQSRVLTYILYLNDLEKEDEGGETEFLYQRKRFRPEKNTLLLWPAGFTHTHKGNLVLAEKNKYIITGWFHGE